MRTYSLTVPLLERTLMVLGYMEMQYHDITVSNQGDFRNFIGISWFRMSLRYSDGGGRPRYENTGLRRAVDLPQTWASPSRIAVSRVHASAPYGRPRATECRKRSRSPG